MNWKIGVGLAMVIVLLAAGLLVVQGKVNVGAMVKANALDGGDGNQPNGGPHPPVTEDWLIELNGGPHPPGNEDWIIYGPTGGPHPPGNEDWIIYGPTGGPHPPGNEDWIIYGPTGGPHPPGDEDW